MELAGSAQGFRAFRSDALRQVGVPWNPTQSPPPFFWRDRGVHGEGPGETPALGESAGAPGLTLRREKREPRGACLSLVRVGVGALPSARSRRHSQAGDLGGGLLNRASSSEGLHRGGSPWRPRVTLSSPHSS